MESTGAALRNDVDDVASTPAVLRGEGVGLNLEFLHVINRGHVDHPSPAHRCVPRPIQQVTGRTEELSAEVYEGDILVGRHLKVSATHIQSVNGRVK